MIGCREGVVGSSYLSTGILQALKGLRRCDFVDQVTVNVEQNCAIWLLVNLDLC